MNNFNINFLMTFNGQTQSYKATEFKKNKEMFRISFPCADDSGISYTVTVLNKQKVTLACSGAISYSIPLEQNKKSRFLLSLYGSEIDCEVFCHSISIFISNGKINVKGRYKLNLSDTVNDYVFTLGGSYDN